MMESKAIQAGELFVTDRPTVITTVLGSCVAVCIWDKTRQIGGMVHFALPCEDPRLTESHKSDYYCATRAITSLLKCFKIRGSSKEDLVVRIVGGGRVLSAMQSDIGSSNVAIAKSILKEFDLPISGECTGGTQGLKVKFFSATGDTYIQRLRQVGSPPSARETSPSGTCKLEGIPPNGRSKPKKLRVLIVDDSKVAQSLLKVMLGQDPRFEVFGVAVDPIEAVELMKADKPDVITLDMQMPRMDGLTYLQKYLPQIPIPVVMVSGAGNSDGELALKALELGAVDFIEKPSADQVHAFAPVIKDKIEAASKVDPRHLRGSDGSTTRIVTRSVVDVSRIICIGSSTGGTVALTKILTQLPDLIPPILIVQHIPEMFSNLFAKRLDSLVSFKVKEAKNLDPVVPGQVLVAPGNKQMKLKKHQSGYQVLITDDEPVNRHKPSVDYFFDSVRNLGISDKVIAGILTGMGRDGAQGLKNLHDGGALTFAQDEESSIVFGMPKEAIKLGAADHVLPLDKVAYNLMDFASSKLKNKKSA